MLRTVNKLRVQGENCGRSGPDSSTSQWPNSEDGSDLNINALLANATSPTIVGGCYPSAQQIANAWNTHEGKKYVDYFLKNKTHGVKTFQDVEIEEWLVDCDDR